MLAGFFIDRYDGNDLWIEFKFERLSELCYICGFLDHIIGRSRFTKPSLMISPNGTIVKLFGPQLRAEHSGCLSLINTQNDEVWRDCVVALETGTDKLVKSQRKVKMEVKRVKILKYVLRQNYTDMERCKFQRDVSKIDFSKVNTKEARCVQG